MSRIWSLILVTAAFILRSAFSTMPNRRRRKKKRKTKNNSEPATPERCLRLLTNAQEYLAERGPRCYNDFACRVNCACTAFSNFVALPDYKKMRIDIAKYGIVLPPFSSAEPASDHGNCQSCQSIHNYLNVVIQKTNEAKGCFYDGNFDQTSEKLAWVRRFLEAVFRAVDEKKQAA